MVSRRRGVVSAGLRLFSPGLSFWAIWLIVLGAAVSAPGVRTAFFAGGGFLWMTACIVESGVGMTNRLRRLALGASRRSGVAGAAGIALLLVPTLFAVFPVWAGWRLVPKLLVLGAWVLSAAIVVARTIRMEGEVQKQSAEAQAHARRRLLHKTLETLLVGSGSHLPAGYVPQVFTPDGVGQRLYPTWDPYALGPVEGWRIDTDPPQAVTGLAWVANKYVYAVGDAVSDATHGLTAAQQRRYKRLTGVSAAAIRNLDGTPIGVLTICTELENPKMREPVFVKLQLALAAEIAVSLIALG
jgi:hypothetical protein